MPMSAYIYDQETLLFRSLGKFFNMSFLSSAFGRSNRGQQIGVNCGNVTAKSISGTFSCSLP